MNCERCLEDEARFRVHSDALNIAICASCAWRALELGIAVELLPRMQTEHQAGDIKESLDPLRKVRF